MIRKGAQELLRTAVLAEVSAFIAEHGHLLDEGGRQRPVRHGFLPEREMMTGIGTVSVLVPRVRDRGSNADGSKITFRSPLVPPCLRKAKSVGELLPWLYLKGISTGDFSEALAALLGPDAEGLSSSAITRLKAAWWEEHEAWRKRDLKGKRYVSIRADGVYCTPLLDGDRQCMLVIIGADEYGEKDILAIADGFRENADNWCDLLRGLRKRGLAVPPGLAVGDGALGFRTALRDVFADTRARRCWVHKTSDVLGALPRSLHERAKTDLQDICRLCQVAAANADGYRTGMPNLADLSRLKGFRFPRSVIGYAVWAYHRFALSLRDVEDLLAERGITVAHETIRSRVGRFGPQIAGKNRRDRPGAADKRHLDEVVVPIKGRKSWLWRAVDAGGDVLDVLLRPHRDKAAALRFFRRLFRTWGLPRVVVTDKLRSYGAAKSDIAPGPEHRRHKGLNNRAEASHRHTRRREKVMGRFKSTGQAQRFPPVHDQTVALFRQKRHRLSARSYRHARSDAFDLWKGYTAELVA